MMDYSSRAGHDLHNHEEYIGTVLSDEICKIFYEKKESFDCFDFGGGVYDIPVADVLEKLPTPEEIRKFIGKKVITKEDSVEIFNALKTSYNERPYTI